jgi:hypothetical protein
MQGEG